MQDKLMPVIQVDDLAPIRAFYTSVLGFEEGESPPNMSHSFAAFSYGSSHIGVTTSDGLPNLPASDGHASLLIIEIPDASGTQKVMSARAEGGVGELLTGWWGAFFDVTDPLGNVFRFLQKSTTIAFDEAAVEVDEAVGSVDDEAGAVEADS